MIRTTAEANLAYEEGLTDVLTAKEVSRIEDEIAAIRIAISRCCPFDEYCPACRDRWVIADMLRDEATDRERLDPLWIRLISEHTIEGVSSLGPTPEHAR